MKEIGYLHTAFGFNSIFYADKKKMLKWWKWIFEKCLIQVSFYLLKLFFIKVNKQSLGLQVHVIPLTIFQVLQSRVNKLSKLTKVVFTVESLTWNGFYCGVLFPDRTCKIPKKWMF